MNKHFNFCAVGLCIVLVGEVFAINGDTASASVCPKEFENWESCKDSTLNLSHAPPAPICLSAPTIEVKAGYFFFASSEMRHIYNHGGVDVQLSGAYPVWKGLQIYGSVGWLQKSGHSLSTHMKTSIWEIPVNVGLKPVITIGQGAAWYCALGPRYFYVHQHNDSSYVLRNKGKSGLGFFVNTGFDFTLWERLLIDIFGEYSYESTHFHTSETNVYTKRMQVGGFTFGGGLGYAF